MSSLLAALSTSYPALVHVLERSATLHLALLARDGTIIWTNGTMAGLLGADTKALEGRDFTTFLTNLDVAMFRACLTGKERAPESGALVNFLLNATDIRTLRCSLIPIDTGVIVVAEPMPENEHALQDELFQLNNQLAVLSRENIRKGRELEKTVHSLSMEIEQRKKAEAELLRYQNQLEGLVRERTFQLEAAKDTAEATSRAKSNFLATVSHELRTPMNAIVGYSHLVVASGLQAVQKEYMGKIHAAGQHLLGIINDILDITSLEEGRMAVRSVPFDLEELMVSFAGYLTVKASGKGLAVRFGTEDKVPRALVGDPRFISQILRHYASNAVKFTDRGEITVSVAIAERSEKHLMLRFTVGDTGIGLTEEQRTFLFSSFHQADMAGTRKYGGVGLGLVNSKLLAQLMGGNVGVESTFGVGSRFWFTVKVDRGEGDACLSISDLQGELFLETAYPKVPSDGAAGSVVLQNEAAGVAPDEKPVLVVDPATLVDACRNLAALLRDDDLAAYNIFSSNEDLFSTAFPLEFQELKSRIRAFDFGAAQELLAGVMEGVGIKGR